jgi:hypothetical protein
VSLLALNFSSRNQIKAKHYIALPVWKGRFCILTTCRRNKCHD